jgi:hypothetical protein
MVIIIAVIAGLKPTRSDFGSEKTSACDAVEQAAEELSNEGYKKEFRIGYSYKTLKRYWLKYN